MHDFYARKEYLHQILEQNQKTIEQMRAFEEETRQQHLEDLARRDNQQCKELASGLHHLVSTKTVPGVFNGIRTRNYRIGNVPVDDYIKHSTKETVRKIAKKNGWCSTLRCTAPA